MAASQKVSQLWKKAQKLLFEAVGGNYYNKVTWTHLTAETAEDKALNERKQTDKDRVLDLLLIMDCTGSMGTWMELLKKTLVECINAVQQQHSELEIRVAFVGYRDFCDFETIFSIHDFTLNHQAVKDYIVTQQPSGGGDAPEDVQGAFQQGLELKWRDNSIKMCYFCSDAPCHGVRYHTDAGDTYRNGNPAGLQLEELVEEFSNRKIDLTVYAITASTNKMFEVMKSAYSKGSNGDEFKIIDLQTALQESQAKGESLTSETSIVALKHLNATTEDMVLRCKNKYLKRGW